MAVNFERGTKRIYLLVSIIWFCGYIGIGLSEFKPQNTIIPLNQKVDLGIYPTLNDSAKKNYMWYSWSDNSNFFSCENWEETYLEKPNYRLFKPQEIDKYLQLEFKNNRQGICGIEIKRTWIQRLDDMVIFCLVFSFMPIPFYYLVIFLINGFREKPISYKRF